MKEKEIVAFYNVENLFDTVDDPETFDDDFTPDGNRKWDHKRYENKVFKITLAIKEIGKENNVAPFLVGLTEVENDTVMNDLVAKLPEYKYIHFDSRDERGIDVALLYDASKFFVTHSENIYVNIESIEDEVDYTRDILYVSGNYKNQQIHVFVVHLPSKRNEDINRNKRIYVLEKLREKINEIQKTEKHPAIILMGDMNENPTSDLIVDKLKTQAEPNQNTPDFLYNPYYHLFQKLNFSLYYKEDGMLFDQILFSNWFLDKQSELQFSSSYVFNNDLLKEWDIQFKEKPFRTYIGKKYLGGYSDHYPVYTILNDPASPLAKYIDNTYLKTSEQAQLSEEQTLEIVKQLAIDSYTHDIKCVMIRPEYVKFIKEVMPEDCFTKVGTVIDFPMGDGGLELKLAETSIAIKDGADELDFVIDYKALKNKEFKKVEEEIQVCTQLALENDKIVKWIIETAALTEKEIKRACELVRQTVKLHFYNDLTKVFIKSSTGFYPKEEKGYNGATEHDIKIMLKNGYPLPIKASGGIRTKEDAEKFIDLGVKRLGTSSADKILNY